MADLRLINASGVLFTDVGRNGLGVMTGPVDRDTIIHTENLTNVTNITVVQFYYDMI